MWKEGNVPRFEVPHLHLSEQTEKRHETPSKRSRNFGHNFEPERASTNNSDIRCKKIQAVELYI
jgi:hypothetical protein